MKKTVENSAYEDQVHFYGRIWMVGALIVMLLVPVSMCIYFGAWPDTLAVLKGLLGVLLFAQLTPVLESSVLKPAFKMILPALFGGLGVVYISKNWKIAVAPLLFMIVLFLIVPSLASSVSVLVPVGALVAIGVARILYKKGKV